MYNVVYISNGFVIASYDNGRDAGEHARGLNESLRDAGNDDRVRVVRVAVDESDEWKLREQARFADYTYQPVPWNCEDWAIAEHFCHVSRKSPANIAYTPSPEHGRDDRQVIMRPGAYLTKHYSDVLDQDQIRLWCAKLSYMMGQCELSLATTSDEIEQVYVGGPHSCMAHAPGYYQSHCHPVRVYGSGDFAVAYIESPDGKITARAVVAPERKVYGRIYGDSDRLRLLLKAAEYQSGNDADDWNGLRLLRLEDDDRFVAPYLDAPMGSVRDTGSYLVIDNDGEIACNETCGLTESRCWCAQCENTCPDTYTVNGEEWCEYCRDHFASYCEGCEEYRHRDDMSGYDRHGNHYCESCAEDMFHCDCCNYLVDSDDIIIAIDTEEYYCGRCARRNLFVTDCGGYTEQRGACDCVECAESREDETTREVE